MPDEKLSKEQLRSALARLDATLRAEGVCGEICLYGGAVMVLAFDARDSTRDVDAIFEPKSRYSRELIPAKTQFFVEETIARLNEPSP